jgi:hypothetical protein
MYTNIYKNINIRILISLLLNKKEDVLICDIMLRLSLLLN